MKKSALLFLLFISIAARGQDSARTVVVSAEGLYADNVYLDGNIYPGVSARIGKHQLFLGPAFQGLFDWDIYNSERGLQGGYRFYPGESWKRLNFFFELTLTYVRNADHRSFEGPTFDPNGGVKLRTYKQTIFEPDLGFGFRLKLFKGFYGHVAAGLGAAWEEERVHYQYWDGTKTTLVSQNSYLPCLPLHEGIFRIGIGFDFMTRRLR